MFESHDVSRMQSHSLQASGRAELPVEVVDAASRELIAPVWALGMRTSALRVPANLSAAERELLDFVDVQAQRIARTVMGLLDVVQVKREGGLRVDAAPFDMDLVCEAAIEELRETGFTRTVDYQREGEGVGEWDPERLARAISYLVELAAESAPPGAPLRLRWRGDADQVAIRVEAGHGGAPSRIDVGWGETLQGEPEGFKAFLARRIAIEHGGTLACFATSTATTYVMVLPRRAPEDLDNNPTA